MGHVLVDILIQTIHKGNNNKTRSTKWQWQKLNELWFQEERAAAQGAGRSFWDDPCSVPWNELSQRTEEYT